MKRMAIWGSLLLTLGCDDTSSMGHVGGGGAGGTGGVGGTGGAATNESTLTISAANPTPLAEKTLGINYWLWSGTWGNNVAGTESAVMALRPNVLRVGGHNNDNNTPDPFNEAQIDAAVAYARAVGAEPLLQVPLLADVDGATPSAETAAKMVTYANVTQGYGVKYFSIGNEPDLYPDQEATRRTFAPADYCAALSSFVPAMRAADPSILIVGPDLSWKYRSGNDWLTPILQGCGDLLDVVAVHRYPIDPKQTTVERAANDFSLFRSDISALRALMTKAGHGQLPLGITEANITYNGDPANPVLSASPGTLAAGLWAADALGVAIEQQLWSFALWSISEGWTLGLIDTQGVPRPAYQTLRLIAEHQGTSLLTVTSARRVNAYATRDDANALNHVNIVNWTEAFERITVKIEGLPNTPGDATFVLPPLSVTALDIPDTGAASGLVYSDAEQRAKSEPAPLSPAP